MKKELRQEFNKNNSCRLSEEQSSEKQRITSKEASLKVDKEMLENTIKFSDSFLEKLLIIKKVTEN